MDSAHAAEMLDAAAGSVDAAVNTFFADLADGHPPSAPAAAASWMQAESSSMGRAAGSSKRWESALDDLIL